MSFERRPKPRKRPVLVRPKPDIRDLSLYPLVAGDFAETFDDPRKRQEFARCVRDPAYYIDNYCIVNNKRDGLVPFHLYGYQRNKVIPSFRDWRKVITRKFRQGGFTTTAAALNTWMINFEPDHEILVISKGDREAKEYLKHVYRFFDYTPSWLRAEVVQSNEHVFELDTGSRIMCYTPTAGVSYSCSLLVIDEAGRVKGMEDKWADIYPILSTGGRVWVISTCNGVVGVGRWYYHKWKQSEEDWSQLADTRSGQIFYPLDVAHTEHPFYQDPAWVEDQRRELGDLRFRQEVLRQFIGTRGSIFAEDLIAELEAECKAQPPIRVMPCPLLPSAAPHRNLQIWEPPRPGQSYMVALDVGEGLGSNDPFGQKDDENAYSGLHVLNFDNMEQVAEYRNDAVKPDDFARVTYGLAKQYNGALVVGADRPIDQLTLTALVNQLGYDNVYSSNPGKRLGLTVTGGSRDQLMLNAVNTVSRKTAPIHSIRLIDELRTIVKRKRIDHLPGYYDDLFSAYAYGWSARESIIASLPPSYQTTLKPLTAINRDGTQVVTDALAANVAEELAAGMDVDRNQPVAPQKLPQAASKMLQDYKEWGV